MDRRTAMMYNRRRSDRDNYNDDFRNEYRNEYRQDYDYYPGRDMRFRDRNGRDHYDNGRYAPQSRYTQPSRYDNITDLRMSSNPIGFATDDSRGYASYDESLTDEEAKEWVEHLKGAEGSNGEHWSLEQTEKVMMQRGIECDPVEFWVVMNTLYSDYYPVFKKYNMGGNVNFYADMAKAWLEDKDAIDNKLAMYYRYVVQH